MHEKSRNICFVEQDSQGLQSIDPEVLRRSREIGILCYSNLELSSLFDYLFQALSAPLAFAFSWPSFWVHFTPQHS